MLFRFVSCPDYVSRFSADIPPVRHLPEWLPGAGFKRTAKEWYAMVTDVSDAPFKNVQGTKVRRPIISLFIRSWTIGSI